MVHAPGYWGPPTSTVDWCEPNYLYSSYVCELFNTLSSFCIVAAGVCGWLLHRRVLERRFLAAFAAVVLVGLGSTAFHATLRFELQMLDELPMVYSALIMVFILVENRPRRRFGRWFPAALAAYGAVLTALCAGTRGALQFAFFQASFGTLEVFALVRVYVIYRRSEDDVLRRLYRAGMAAYAIAVVAWTIDLRACSWLSVRLPGYGIPNPQLHAVWHVLVSCGLYLLTMVIARDRLTTLGVTSQVAWRAGLPRLQAVTTSERRGDDRGGTS